MNKKITRREFLKAATTGLAGAALLGTTACSNPVSSTQAEASSKVKLTLWYWSGSIDDKVLAQVPDHFPNVNLQASKIGGDFKSKLLTSLAGEASVPDITGINSDISTYFPDADQFVNLYDLGAKSVQHLYLDWKWKQGVTPEGKMIGFPMDTGPTALFYRHDMFKQAGLPTDPSKVADKIRTWDQYFQVGKQLQAALPGKFMLDSVPYVFVQVMAQSPKQYMDPHGNFIGDQPHVKRAWDLAVKAHQMRIAANTDRFTTDWNAAADNGTFVTFVGAVWMQNSLEQAAPDTSGKWHVCRAPGGAGNNGGSFLAVTKYSKHPRKAFDVIKWVQSPPHQLQSYYDPGVSLFPSTPSVYDDPKMRQPVQFFGGQVTADVFSTSAEHVKPIYFGPAYDIINPIYSQQLTDVATQGKNPDRAWNDTIQQIERELVHNGYKV